MAYLPVETPTLVERFISLAHLPYPLAALFWSIVLGSPGYYTLQYLTTRTSTFSIADLPTETLFFLVPLYLFLAVHYLRMRIVAGEAPIAVSLTGGEEDYHKAFGRMNLALPPVALAFLFGTPILSLLNGPYYTVGLNVQAIFEILVVYIITLAFSTYAWVFAIASLGLHNLGSSSLKLGSFLEERMMGAKPMGNLALSMTIAYFAGLLIVIVLFAGMLANVTAELLFLGLIILGIALFILPLNGIHKRMQVEKRRILHEIGARYAQMNQANQANSPTTEKATLDDLNLKLERLNNLQQLEMLDRKASSLPTWPFDIQVVSKFITIVLSVTAVLLSRVITGFLHI